MPVWIASYYDGRTNELVRKGRVRADTKAEADKIIADNRVMGETITLVEVPIRDDAKYEPGYTAVPL